MASVYDDDGKELYYFDENGYFYESSAVYHALVEDWKAKRATCKEYADKVIKCRELERSTAVICELFNSVVQSVTLAQNQLGSASTLSRAVNESNMTDAADLIDDLKTAMDDETSKCEEASTELETISEALKKAGEKYTTLHNEAYPPYKSACNAIHVDVEDFTGGEE